MATVTTEALERGAGECPLRAVCEPPLVRSRLGRAVLTACGTLAVALGFLGVFLPVLPTTPFLLLAAACYARSSPRFYAWLLSNRWFGQYIRDWREGRGVPIRAKILAIGSIVIFMGSSIVFFVPVWPGKLALAVIGVLVIRHMLRLPTRRPEARPGAPATADSSIPADLRPR